MKGELKMTLKINSNKNEDVRNNSSQFRNSEHPFRTTNTQSTLTLLAGKEPIMKKANLILLLAMAVIFIIDSPLLSADYGIYCGDNDADYEVTKHKQQAFISVFNSLGLNKDGYWWSNSWHFYENAMVESYWTYTYPGFDSDMSDSTCVTVVDAHSGTYKDYNTNNFYFIIGTRYGWNGYNNISNLEKYGTPLRLGESPNYFWNDSYEGYCRYLILLGCNSVALGPAYTSTGHTTFSRPDLFQKDNSNHANPFTIWEPVMTDGLRLVLGYTDFAYSSTSDYDNWVKFKDYHDKGYSIAQCFAETSLDADSRQIPVAISQGATEQECYRILDERDFSSSRPEGSRWIAYRYWHRGPLSDNSIALFRSGEASSEKDVLSDDTRHLRCSGYIYESTDSKKAEAEFSRRYLDIFGLGNANTMYEQRKEQTIYRRDTQDEARLNHRDGSFYYRNPEVYISNQDSVILTRNECVDRAFSLLVDHSIVTPKEIELDSVISIRQMAASEEEIATGVFNSEPDVIGYISVFKRKLGRLPIISNRVDTIKVEISVNGEVASLISNYKHGRILTERELVQPLLTSVKEAQESLSWMDTIDDVEAGLLPLEDGDYVPVYKVTTSDADSTSMPSLKVQYLRQDTLEPVSFRAENAIDGYEIQDNGVQN
jgi:hypothetical protein